jgi:BON domain
MKRKASLYSCMFMLLVLVAAVGCAKPPNDNQIATDVQSKLGANSGLANKQLIVQVDHGSVTLGGSVDNDAQRDAAARYASSVAGVKQVVNNLQVSPVTPPPPVVATEQAPPAPTPSQEKSAPSRKQKRVERERKAERNREDAPDNSNQMAQTYPPPMPEAAPAPAPDPVPVTPPPPPPPVKITVPTGTTLAVRLEDALDSEANQIGQTFAASLTSAITTDGEVAVPAGSRIQGHIVDLKSAGKFAGQSLLVLQLDNISSGGRTYNLSTDQFKKEGSSRGRNTAEKVGAGAGIGAIIGALAGGGKGAAIGAAAGGGLGGGVQAATKGQQIKLPVETVLNFTLQAPVTVIQTSRGPNAGRPQLDQQ